MPDRMPIVGDASSGMPIIVTIVGAPVTCIHVRVIGTAQKLFILTYHNIQGTQKHQTPSPHQGVSVDLNKSSMATGGRVYMGSAGRNAKRSRPLNDVDSYVSLRPWEEGTGKCIHCFTGYKRYQPLRAALDATLQGCNLKYGAVRDTRAGSFMHPVLALHVAKNNGELAKEVPKLIKLFEDNKWPVPTDDLLDSIAVAEEEGGAQVERARLKIREQAHAEEMAKKEEEHRAVERRLNRELLAAKEVSEMTKRLRESDKRVYNRTTGHMGSINGRLTAELHQAQVDRDGVKEELNYRASSGWRSWRESSSRPASGSPRWRGN
eukprot:jgi/Mesvir1/13920/Mv16041-RA.1